METLLWVIDHGAFLTIHLNGKAIATVDTWDDLYALSPLKWRSPVSRKIGGVESKLAAWAVADR